MHLRRSSIGTVTIPPHIEERTASERSGVHKTESIRPQLDPNVGELSGGVQPGAATSRLCGSFTVPGLDRASKSGPDFAGT